MHLKIQSQRIKKKGIAKLLTSCFKSPINMPISKMNMFGLGNLMMRYVMKRKMSILYLLLLIKQLSKVLNLSHNEYGCDGHYKEELRDDVEYGGVGAYIGYTEQANHNLFI